MRGHTTYVLLESEIRHIFLENKIVLFWSSKIVQLFFVDLDFELCIHHFAGTKTNDSIKKGRRQSQSDVC